MFLTLCMCLLYVIFFSNWHHSICPYLQRETSRMGISRMMNPPVGATGKGTPHVLQAEGFKPLFATTFGVENPIVKSGCRKCFGAPFFTKRGEGPCRCHPRKESSRVCGCGGERLVRIPFVKIEIVGKSWETSRSTKTQVIKSANARFPKKGESLNRPTNEQSFEDLPLGSKSGMRRVRTLIFC